MIKIELTRNAKRNYEVTMTCSQDSDIKEMDNLFNILLLSKDKRGGYLNSRSVVLEIRPTQVEIESRES
jgi:hypothetical protein